MFDAKKVKKDCINWIREWFDKNGNGKVLQKKYLGYITYDSKKGLCMFNNTRPCTKPDQLLNAIAEWVDNLPWCSDYYCPYHRNGIKDGYIFRDYMKSLGFVPVRGEIGADTFKLTGFNPFFKGDYITVSAKFDEDKTSGILMVTGPTNDYRWMQDTYEDYVDLIGKVNSILSSMLIISGSWTLQILNKMHGEPNSLDNTTINLFDLNSFKTHSATLKESLIDELESTLNTLKNM
jgi:hypothetical protein